MAKRAFWKTDWFFGLVITIVFLIYSNSATVQGIERWAYDIGVRSTERSPASNIAVIAIDDQSVANLGRWPWPRSTHAKLFNGLSQAGAKVIAPSLFLFEPQQDPGAVLLNEIHEFYRSSSLGERVASDIGELDLQLSGLEKYQQLVGLLGFYNASSLKSQVAEDLQELEDRFSDASIRLNHDGMLASSIADAGNVILPMLFELDYPQGRPDSQLPDYISQYKLGNITDQIGAAQLGALPVPAIDIYFPIESLGRSAAGIAHLNQTLDVDGGIRVEPLVVDYFGEYFPSFAALVAAKSLNLEGADIQVHLGEGVRLGNLVISTDETLGMNTFFYSDSVEGTPAFPVDSFFDVASGKIPYSKYKNKIVLIGPTAAGISTPQKTPVNEAMHPVLALAHSVSSILNEDFFVIPEWSVIARLSSLLVVAIYLIFLFPAMSASLAALITIVLATGLFGSEYFLMTTQVTWVPLMSPLLLLVIGHVLLTTKRYLWTERSKGMVEADSSETNRTLGMQFQGQGQLDMAFEKFRKCNVDEVLLDNLYNLALDYERKRQFNKAGNVYRYITDQDAKFRDVKERLDKAVQMENTMVFGAPAAGGTAGATVLFGEGQEKPKLGRFQIEKELGKGAMGMVYLGTDPKINREVAIKTMALSQEFEADELDEVKARFFREAQSAGRLSHPNIVTIYDTGEEFDLAYIAMELLKGDDLNPYVKKDNLLPIGTVLEIASKTADALNYAHRQNIVHRDVKPANVMYEPGSQTVKVADFGIARITDSSKTKTGIVLGTPSYMSPEQLSGKHVDGRSDLFSLGVMLYQMVSGDLPFKADSLASLMFKIANEQPQDVLSIRSDLPECLVKIIYKSLEKSLDDRYQTGAEMKADLDSCLAEFNSSADWVIA